MKVFLIELCCVRPKMKDIILEPVSNSKSNFPGNLPKEQGQSEESRTKSALNIQMRLSVNVLCASLKCKLFEKDKKMYVRRNTEILKEQFWSSKRNSHRNYRKICQRISFENLHQIKIWLFSVVGAHHKF